MIASVKNVLRILCRQGPAETVRFIRWRAYEKRMERELGINTGGDISTADLGITNGESRRYVATDYTTLKVLFDFLGVTEKDVLVDFGCGKGRICIFAGLYPFYAIHGVDISESLCNIAHENYLKVWERLQGTVFLHPVDATKYAVPCDTTVIFFANPFTGSILDAVMGNILRSWEANPRLLRIACNDFSVHSDFCKQMTAYPWLTVEKRIPLRTPGQVGSIYRVKAPKR